MPLLWPKFDSKSIHKTNEDPDFHHAEIECQTDNISKRYFDNGVNKKGTNSSDGHFDVSSSNFGIFGKQKKSVLHPCQILQLLGTENEYEK